MTAQVGEGGEKKLSLNLVESTETGMDHLCHLKV